MNRRTLLVAALLAVAGPATAGDPFDGSWDLFWKTRQGVKQEGWLVLDQTGRRVVAQIYGKGSLRAAGEVRGSTFAVRGRKMGAPFTISARLEDGRLSGSVKVLSVDRPFTGVRRK